MSIGNNNFFNIIYSLKAYDEPESGVYDNYDEEEDDKSNKNNDGYNNVARDGTVDVYVDTNMVCCDHYDIIPEVLEDTNLVSCDAKPGFKCIPQDVSRT